MKGRILIVAGSDSGGGAGIQADIKTVTALGGYAATAVTALTAQNTLGVDGILPVPPDFVARQMAAVLSDIGADAIKTGMLFDGAIVEAVADAREKLAPRVPLVVDPVMVSSSGTRLLDAAAIDTLKRRLITHAAVITPNLPEAEVLLGRRIADVDGMRQAAAALRQTGPRAVVITGGHLAGATVTDVIDSDGLQDVLEARRIDTRHTHGTGCTFASAIATGLAQGLDLGTVIRRAHAYVQEAIRGAPGLGHGAGPINHTPPLWKDDNYQ